jgi:hypothetical protein
LLIAVPDVECAIMQVISSFMYPDISTSGVFIVHFCHKKAVQGGIGERTD